MYSPGIVRECGRIPGGKVKGASARAAYEDGGSSLAFVEVQPLLGLSSVCLEPLLPEVRPCVWGKKRGGKTYVRVPM